MNQIKKMILIAKKMKIFWKKKNSRLYKLKLKLEMKMMMKMMKMKRKILNN